MSASLKSAQSSINTEMNRPATIQSARSATALRIQDREETAINMASGAKIVEAKTVLLLIDVINELDFPCNEEIIKGVPELALDKMKAKKSVLPGLAADICVIYTANDAYMRGFELTVIEDGVLANTQQDTAIALQKMKTLLKAKIIDADHFIAQLSSKQK